MTDLATNIDTAPRKPTLYEIGRKLSPMLMAALERIEAEDAAATVAGSGDPSPHSVAVTAPEPASRAADALVSGTAPSAAPPRDNAAQSDLRGVIKTSA